jgi:hypothetical protein
VIAVWITEQKLFISSLFPNPTGIKLMFDIYLGCFRCIGIVGSMRDLVFRMLTSCSAVTAFYRGDTYDVTKEEKM